MGKISFVYKITRWSNFYFFIQNLSCWHFSCIDKYNEVWRQKLPDLTDEQEDLLLKFADVRKSEPASNSIFEEAFYLSEDPISVLEGTLMPKDFDVVKKIFEIFEDNFEKIFSKEEPKLQEWKKALEATGRENFNSGIENDLEIFYNEKTKHQKSLNCYLLLAPAGHSGSFIAEGLITQELSSLPIEKPFVEEILGTIWHETIHAFFDKHYFSEILSNFSSNSETRRMLKEITASSLLPLGYLGNKHLGLKITKSIYRRYEINETTTAKIMELSKNYIVDQLVVDKIYLATLNELIEKGRLG